ncbi:hypothetical protein AAG906_033788 [Vitis piasezkii]
MCDALGTISELQEIPKRSVNEVSLGPRLKIPHNLKMPFSSTLLLNLKTIDERYEFLKYRFEFKELIVSLWYHMWHT